MDRDHTQGFNERLSQWIASQGFWFQLRYSLTGTSGYSSIAYQIVRLALRLVIFMVVVGLGGSYLVYKRTSRPAFVKDLSSRLETQIDAQNVKFQNYVHKGGELRTKTLKGEGKSSAFYTQFEAADVSCNMSPLSTLAWFDRLTGGWDAGVLRTRTLRLGLKPGYDSAEAAAQGAACLFREHAGFSFSRWEVADATLYWGYSEAAKAAIEHTAMIVRRDGDAWKIEMKGGYFRHGWLERLEIIELQATCDRSGIVFDKAEFRLQKSPVQVENLRLIAGERPQVTGLLKLNHAPLSSLLVEDARSWMDGTISGPVQIKGSTNDSTGLSFTGHLEVKEHDSIVLREGVPLLHALVVIDSQNDYHRVAFRGGGMDFTARGSRTELRNIALHAETMQVRGQLTVRRPTKDEISQWKAKHLEVDKAPAEGTPQKTDSPGDDEPRPVVESTLPKAETSSELYQRVAGDLERKFAFSQLCEGEVVLTLPPQVFQRLPALQSRFAPDMTGKIRLTVPLNGEISKLTKDQAELILEESRHSQ